MATSVRRCSQFALHEKRIEADFSQSHSAHHHFLPVRLRNLKNLASTHIYSNLYTTQHTAPQTAHLTKKPNTSSAFFALLSSQQRNCDRGQIHRGDGYFLIHNLISSLSIASIAAAQKIHIVLGTHQKHPHTERTKPLRGDGKTCTVLQRIRIQLKSDDTKHREHPPPPQNPTKKNRKN